MARRRHDAKQKREISIRLQRIVDDRFGSLYELQERMKELGHGALASTIRGWLPPQERWTPGTNGAGVRKVDWDAVKSPSLSALATFCDILSVRSDHILFGEGEASRGQSRGLASLAHDIAAHVAEALQSSGVSDWTAASIDGALILSDAVDAAREEAPIWLRRVALAPVRGAAADGMLLDAICELIPLLPTDRETIKKILALNHLAAHFEEHVESNPGPPELWGGGRTRYLAPLSGNVMDKAFSLLAPSIETRFRAAIDRMDAKSPAQKRLTEVLEKRYRSLQRGQGAKLQNES